MMKERENRSVGTRYVLISAFFWGVGNFLVKSSLSPISPLVVSFWMALIATILLIATFPSSVQDSISAFRSRPIPLLATGILGVVLGNTLLVVGLQRLDLSIAALIESCRPIMTVALGWLILGETVRARTIPFAITACLSALLISVGDPFRHTSIEVDLFGIFAVLGASLSWALASVIGRSIVTNGISPEAITILRFGIGTVVFIPILFVTNEDILQVPTDLLPFLYLASLLFNALGYLLYYRGLRYIPAGTTNILQLSAGIVAAVLGVSLLEERLSQWQCLGVLGLILSLIGVLKSQTSSKNQYLSSVKQRPARLLHS